MNICSTVKQGSSCLCNDAFLLFNGLAAADKLISPREAGPFAASAALPVIGERQQCRLGDALGRKRSHDSVHKQAANALSAPASGNRSMAYKTRQPPLPLRMEPVAFSPFQAVKQVRGFLARSLRMPAAEASV